MPNGCRENSEKL